MQVPQISEIFQFQNLEHVLRQMSQRFSGLDKRLDSMEDLSNSPSSNF